VPSAGRPLAGTEDAVESGTDGRSVTWNTYTTSRHPQDTTLPGLSYRSARLDLMSSLEVMRTVVPWSGGAGARPLDRGAAVERLPGSVELDPFERLAMAFLIGYTASTARVLPR
jgi:hypothetical protein